MEYSNKQFCKSKIIGHISIFNENFEKQLIDYVMITENKFYGDY